MNEVQEEKIFFSNDNQIVDADSPKINKVSGKSTLKEGLSNFCFGCIGLGILGLPSVAIHAGYLYASFLIIVIGFLCFCSVRLLSDSANEINLQSPVYGDLCTIVFGNNFGNIVNIAVALQNIAICIAYVIYIAETIQIICEYLDVEMNHLYQIFSSFLIILPLTFITDLHRFHKFSRAGLVMQFCAVFILIAYLVYQKGIIDNQLNLGNPINLNYTFRFIGVAVFAYTTITSILPIKHSMINNEEHKKVELFGHIIVGLFYLIYILINTTLTNENESQDISLYNIQNVKYTFYFLLTQIIFQMRLKLIAIILYAFSICFHYPFVLFPVTQTIDIRILKLKDGELSTNSILSRILLNLAIFLCAYYISSIIDFLSFVGNFFGIILQFLVPISIYLKLGLVKDYAEGIKIIILTIVSIIVLIIGSIESMILMIN